MRKIPYLLAAAAISGFALSATPGNASPLAGGLTSGNVTVPEASEGLVQKVHGYHCRKKYSNRRGWHRHRRACHRTYYYDDYYDDDYYYRPYYRPYRHHYGFGFPFPFFGFHFGGRRHGWWDD
jgi:hypothetical protein